MKRSLIPLLILAMFTGCQPVNTKVDKDKQEDRKIDGQINISGAYAIYPLLDVWAKEFHARHPGVSISLARNGTGQGLDDLRTGRVDIAMLSRDLSPAEEEMNLNLIAVAKDAVVPIISSQNPLLQQIREMGLSHDQIQKVFTQTDKTSWGLLLNLPSGEPVQTYTRTDASGALNIWSNFLMTPPEEILGTGVRGDIEMVEAVSKDPHGLGYCNMIYVWDSVLGRIKPDIAILPIDMNYNRRIDYKESLPETMDELKRHMKIGKYPHGLCRYLYMATTQDNHKPAVQAFVEYILTDGQQHVEGTGYCKVPGYILRQEVERIHTATGQSGK